jgi:hypothetical protein
MRDINARKYVTVFLITAVIFMTAIYVSNYFAERRMNEIKAIQNKISIDILSSETQFDLLKEASCKDLDATILSPELNDLASRLSFMEESLGNDNPQVVELKKYYSLLEIKDYLLNKKIAEKCGKRPAYIVYLYSNLGDCPDCKKAGYVLTYLRETYPDLRVYSFDYNLDLSAVKTMLSLYRIGDTLPALIVNDKVITGYQEKSVLEKMLNLKPKATSTPAKIPTN